MWQRGANSKKLQIIPIWAIQYRKPDSHSEKTRNLGVKQSQILNISTGTKLKIVKL